MVRISKRSIASIAVSFSAAALVALGTAVPSMAADKPLGNVTVSSSVAGLGIGFGFQDFANVLLNGRAQTVPTTLIVSNIVDARGSGLGWHLTLSMTNFVLTGTPALHPLADGSLTVKNTPALTAQDPSSSDPNGINKGTVLDPMSPLDSLLAAPVMLLSAPANQGMGSYTLTPIELSLNLPASTYAQKYTSTASVTVASAP